jgi:hypothetical protein
MHLLPLGRLLLLLHPPHRLAHGLLRYQHLECLYVSLAYRLGLLILNLAAAAILPCCCMQLLPLGRLLLLHPPHHLAHGLLRYQRPECLYFGLGYRLMAS